MTTGSDKQASPPRRRVRNIYDRLEEARQQRAEVLATPKPANKSTPVETKVFPGRVFAKKRPGRERLPPLVPATTAIVTEPASQVQLKPMAKHRPLVRHAIVVALLMTLILGLRSIGEGGTLTQTLTPPALPQESTLRSNLSPTPALEAPSIALPVIAAQDIPVQELALPVFSITPVKRVADTLQASSQDELPIRPSLQLAGVPEVQVDTWIATPDITFHRPPQNPRFEAPVEKGLSPDLQISAFVPENFNIISLIPPETPSLDLQPLINLPRTISRGATRDIEIRVAALGLPWSSPDYFDFNVSKTQVRYYHDSDRADAEVMAREMEASLRDFTGFRPRPPEGRVELWVAGRAKPAQRSDTAGPLDGVRRDLRQLGSNLQRSLRALGRQR